VIKEILDFVAKVYAARGKRLETVEIYEAVTPLLRERTENTMKSFFEELRAEGEARGEARGKQDMVLAALRKKFANVPQYIETAIRRMSDPIALESLIGDVIVSQTLDEFATALR
jgi:uncharacterized Ntn-hydrolase superfamily protein